MKKFYSLLVASVMIAGFTPQTFAATPDNEIVRFASDDTVIVVEEDTKKPSDDTVVIVEDDGKNKDDVTIITN